MVPADYKYAEDLVADIKKSKAVGLKSHQAATVSWLQ
jgi:hypothetical protein